jgi:hypothetical protein
MLAVNVPPSASEEDGETGTALLGTALLMGILAE